MPGQRVRMNRTGWTATVVNVNRFGARVLWDQSGYEGVVALPRSTSPPSSGTGNAEGVRAH
jgi:hypothetical protein